jgi:hypothetical protein
MNDFKQKPIHMVFEPGETGHGTLIGPGIARVDNIPYTDRLNLNDLVKVENDGGRWVAREVIERALPKKTAFDYEAPFKETFAKLCEVWGNANIHYEGVFEGLVLVAHREDQNPLQIAEQAGLWLHLHSAQPDLEPIP